MDKHLSNLALVPQLPRQKDEDLIIAGDGYNDEDFKQMIRSLHLKVTHQRMTILKAFHQGRRHVTAQELYEMVNADHPEIGFATVYRFLRSLSEAHLVTEMRMGGSSARYELTPKHHHDHMTCTKCGKICEFENKAIEALQEKVAQQLGFVLTHHVLELYGVCSSCR